MRTLTMKKADYEAMVRHARACLPEEACGLIAGTDRDGKCEILHVYALENTDHSPEHFTLSPKDQLSAVKDMRSHGWVPLGNWHSHPETPSRPSEEDRRLAHDSRASYLILSLMDRDHPVLNAFHVENLEASREELVLVDGTTES